MVWLQAIILSASFGCFTALMALGSWRMAVLAQRTDRLLAPPVSDPAWHVLRKHCFPSWFAVRSMWTSSPSASETQVSTSASSTWPGAWGEVWQMSRTPWRIWGAKAGFLARIPLPETPWNSTPLQRTMARPIKIAWMHTSPSYVRRPVPGN